MPPTQAHAKKLKSGPLEEVKCQHCDTKMQHKALTDHHKRYQHDENHKGKEKAYYKSHVKKMTFFQKVSSNENQTQEVQQDDQVQEIQQEAQVQEDKQD